MNANRLTAAMTFAVSALCLLVLFVLVWFATEAGRSGSAEMLRDRLRRAAVHCYALEGAYPADADYLERYYGVTIHHGRYYVRYDYTAPDIPPNILVFEN